MISSKNHLPKGWRLVQLGDITHISTGGTPSTTHPEYYGGTIRWLTSGDVKGTYIYDVPHRITQQGLDNSNAKLHPPGSVMLAMSGQGKTRGTSAILIVPSACSQSVAAILPTDEALPEIIHFALVNLYDDIRRITGDNERTGLNLKIIGKIEIPLPPLDEQKRIAKILNEQMTSVEKARAAAEARLEAAKALPAAYLREVFPKPGQELPKVWKWVQLGDIFDVKQGVAMSPTRRKGIALHPFLRTLNIQWGYVDLSNLDKMDFNDDEVTNLKLRNGDLLVCEGGDVGRTAIWKGELDDCLYQNHIHRLRQKDNLVISDFYVYWLQIAFLVFHSYKGKNSTTTIPNLSGGQLKSFLVPLPPKIEQNQIVLRLNEKMGQAQYLVKTIQSEFEFINALPAVLLHRAFTGGL